MRIVDTDNFNSDYPNEKFILWRMSKVAAEEIADRLNAHFSGTNAPRYYKVVEDDYKLEPGFEP